MPVWMSVLLKTNISTFCINICENNIRKVLFNYLTVEDYIHTGL